MEVSLSSGGYLCRNILSQGTLTCTLNVYVTIYITEFLVICIFCTWTQVILSSNNCVSQEEVSIWNERFLVYFCIYSKTKSHVFLLKYIFNIISKWDFLVSKIYCSFPEAMTLLSIDRHIVYLHDHLLY